MMREMTIAVIVVSASCHYLTWADSGWSRISWFSRKTLPWLRGGTSVAPWRQKCSHVPVFRRLFDRLPVRISTPDLHHRILRKKLYHIRAYDFGVQFSFNKVANVKSLNICSPGGISSRIAGQGELFSSDSRACTRSPCDGNALLFGFSQQQLQCGTLWVSSSLTEQRRK